jgi:hypothetical protein
MREREDKDDAGWVKWTGLFITWNITEGRMGRRVGRDFGNWKVSNAKCDAVLGRNVKVFLLYNKMCLRTSDGSAFDLM